MTKAKEPKRQVEPVSFKEAYGLPAKMPQLTDPKAWHCDICGADLVVDVCPTDGKARP